MTASFSSIAALVLAGGRGARLGGDKPLLVLAGRPLLAHAIAFARTQAARVALAVRERDWADISPELERIPDSASLEGPLAGLSEGLSWAGRTGARWLLTVPCDAPFLPPDLALRLLEAAERGKARAVIPASGGQLHPASALWRVDLAEQLAAHAARGRRSLTGFAEAVGAIEVAWQSSTADPFLNINTPEDLALAQVLAAARPLADG